MVAAHFPQEWKVTAALAPVRQRSFPCSYEMPAPTHAAAQPSLASRDTPSITRVPGSGTAHDPAPGEAELRAGKCAGKDQVTDLLLVWLVLLPTCQHVGNTWTSAALRGRSTLGKLMPWEALMGSSSCLVRAGGSNSSLLAAQFTTSHASTEL